LNDAELPLRDTFACAAMQSFANADLDDAEIATRAYALASAMIDARRLVQAQDAARVAVRVPPAPTPPALVKGSAAAPSPDSADKQARLGARSLLPLADPISAPLGPIQGLPGAVSRRRT